MPAIRDRSGGDRAPCCALAAAFWLGLAACSGGSTRAAGVDAGAAPPKAGVDSDVPSPVPEVDSDGSLPASAVDSPVPLLDAGEEDAVEEAAISDYCAEAGGRGAGAAFADLYRDFFGPSGPASCSAASNCHVPGGTGAQTSGGYECSPDESTCWASMTSTIVPKGGSPTPDQTTLYRALRKAPPTPGSGPMPRNSTFAFCPDDLARIRSWIAAGAAGP